jgi:histidinol-phosphate/aromatic aminotransferase/cobyric acid decarboxylase-like protein
VKASIRKATGKINSGTREAREHLERVLLSKYGTGPESILFANSLSELVFAVTRGLKPANVLIALNIYRDAALELWSSRYDRHGRRERTIPADPQKLLEKSGEADLVFLANPNRITGRPFRMPRLEASASCRGKAAWLR